MRALAIQRWLLGLLVWGLLAAPGRSEAKPGVSAPPPIQAVAPQVQVAPFTAPAAMPALGEELARALFAALREANIPARLGKTDEGSAISGRLEEISQAQVRLHASYRGHSVQSVGDLEHLDDLVYAVFTQLRPRLQPLVESGDNRTGALTRPDPGAAGSHAAPAGAPAPTESPPAALAVLNSKSASADPVQAVVQASLTTAARAPGDREPKTAKRSAKELVSERNKDQDPAHDKDHDKQSSRGAARTSGGKDAAGPDPGSKDASPAPERASRSDTYALAVPRTSAATPSEPGPPAAVTAARPPDPNSLPPGAETSAAGTRNPPGAPIASPRPTPQPFAFDPRRPRVAVHVVGEPLARVPPGYYGLGTVGQQTLISYLQQRWRVPALGSRLVGLTGGLPALDQSLRLGARHTLMARLDSLTLSSSPVVSPGLGPAAAAGGTLSGRIHVVLLLDGKLLLDRSIMMPPTLILASETPAQAYSRILYAAMDSVASEFYARLVQPPG